jgi:hypothetical protein
MVRFEVQASDARTHRPRCPHLLGHLAGAIHNLTDLHRSYIYPVGIRPLPEAVGIVPLHPGNFGRLVGVGGLASPDLSPNIRRQRTSRNGKQDWSGRFGYADLEHLHSYRLHPIRVDSATAGSDGPAVS